MFITMESRKRARFELINANNSNETLQGVASTTAAMGTTTLATIGGQSFILSNTLSSSLPANILLSICNDNSDESEEYLIDSPMLTHIKEESSVSTQTTNNQTQQHLPNVVTSVPQYRIVNQTGKCLNNSSHCSPSMVNSGPITSNSTVLSNSVHLPPGCEIYVIKEVIDTPKQVIAEPTSPKGLSSNTTIKLEPMSPVPILRNSTSLNGNANRNLNANSALTINTTNAIASNTLSTSTDDTAKRSLILEAYKKRDDKRRATHNEVERRRRDKINSWIFKLKEMLPSEVTPSNGSNLLNKDTLTAGASLTINQNISTARLLVQQQGATRTPPSDSKSQILIKACEYIKSMQEEIKSLRECLTENENLRLSNQRLQDEINSLRGKQQQKQPVNNNNILLTTTNNSSNNHNNNKNNNININDNTDDCDEITLNSLNASYANVQLFAPPSTNQSNHHHHHLTGMMGLTTNSNISSVTTPTSVNVTYAKRELIITDYVD